MTDPQPRPDAEEPASEPSEREQALLDAVRAQDRRRLADALSQFSMNLGGDWWAKEFLDRGAERDRLQSELSEARAAVAKATSPLYELEDYFAAMRNVEENLDLRAAWEHAREMCEASIGYAQPAAEKAEEKKR